MKTMFVLAGLSADLVSIACITAHTPPLASPAVSPEVRQLLLIQGAMADYAKTEQITIVRDEHGKPVRFRFKAKGND